MIAAPRFLAFLAVLVIAAPIATHVLHNAYVGVMAGFDVAAIVFLASSVSLLGTREAAVIRQHAIANDATKTLLLVITGVVMAVLLIAIAAETVGHPPQPFTRILIIGTLALAWLFSNTIYALHYAHLAYVHPNQGCAGIDFPETPEPVYWDFVYFAFTIGMTFQTSDVVISSQRIRKVVTAHCFAAFVFNIGVLAFTINVLGSG